MLHQHGLSHHVRRQRDRDEEDETETETKIVVLTMPNTLTGDVVWITKTSARTTAIDVPVQATTARTTQEPDKTLLPPATREPSSTARESKESKESDADKEESAKPTSSSKPSSTRPSIATASTFAPLSSTFAAASSTIGGLAAATGSPSSSPSPSSEAAGSSGMSGGAKAGLALGILFAVGALLGAILFVAHRKKKQVAQQNADDEKFAMRETLPPPPPPHVEPASSIRTQRTMSTAPRLSLRPLTQFDPMFPNRKSGGNMLDIAAAGAVAHSGDRSPSSDRPGTSYSWERPGAANAAPAPVNPFNDPQTRSVSPPQDPFTNSAAIETPQASSMAANHAASPRPDFGNPAPAIAAAETASLMAALPAPPRNKANHGSVPPSPTWTEDIPASPGPAPSGPLPVAAAGGPKGAAPPPNDVHRVQLDFKPSMSDELGLSAGQLVRMLHEYDDGWALCVRMDRSQQGVVPRTCISKHPVKPRQGPPGPRTRGPPVSPPIGQGRIPQHRPLPPASGRSSPHPPSLSPASGRNSPAPRSPRSTNQGPRQMPPPQQGRARSNSNASFGGVPQMAPPPSMGRPRANSAGQPAARRQPPSGPSRMNPNPTTSDTTPMPHRKPLPGQAL